MTTIERVILVLVLLQGLGGSARSSAEAPSAGGPAISITRHDLTVVLDPAAHRLRVADRVSIKAGDPEVKEVVVSLNQALAVARVSRDGRSLPFFARPGGPPGQAHAGGARHIVVPLDQPVRAGETVTLDFDYAGEINDPPREPRHLRFVTPSETSGHIGPEGVYIGPETSWYPDLPESLAVYRVAVTVPSGWEAIAQDRLLAREVTARETVTTWEASAPAEGLTLAAGKFEVATRTVGTVEVATYFYPEDAGLADQYLTAAAAYLQAYSALLGPYPFTRFSIVENFFASGLGMPSYTLLGAGPIRRRYTQPYALGHEIVHSWIGNHVFNDGGGNWVEGLTTYLSNYYWHELQGDPQKARDERRMMLLNYAVFVPPGQDYPIARFTRKSDQRDNAIGYSKAAMVFHMLRGQIGDGRFFAALRRLVAEYGGRRVGWRELEAVFSREGSGDLRPFFARWIEQPGAAEVAAADDPDYRVFRRIARRDLPAMLNLFVTDPDRLVVVPDGDPAMVAPYRELAERVASHAGAGVRSARDLGAGDRGLGKSSVLLLGGHAAGAAFAWARRGLPDGVDLREDSFVIGGRDYRGAGLALLLSFRNPDDPDHVVAVFYGLSPAAVKPVAPLLFFYGWNSYVVFDNGKVIARGDGP